MIQSKKERLRRLVSAIAESINGAPDFVLEETSTALERIASTWEIE